MFLKLSLLLILLFVLMFIFSLLFISAPNFYYKERVVFESHDKKYKIHIVDYRTKGDLFNMDTFKESAVFLENISIDTKIECFKTTYTGEEWYVDMNNHYNNISVKWYDEFAIITIELLSPEYTYSYHYEELNEKFEVVGLINYKVDYDK